MDKQRHRSMILVDLQKAFDTLEHGNLVSKMKYFGFWTSVIHSFEFYLSNKKFLVCIDVFFWGCDIKYGAPQGSILWSFLYLDNLPKSLPVTGSYLYEDDAYIFHQHKDVRETENVLNKKFSSLCQWFINSKVPIHFEESKNKSMPFSKMLRKINIFFVGRSRIPWLTTCL